MPRWLRDLLSAPLDSLAFVLLIAVGSGAFAMALLQIITSMPE